MGEDMADGSRRWSKITWPAALGGALLVILGGYFAYRLLAPSADVKNPLDSQEKDQTEWIFQHYVSHSDALYEPEWRAARSDHRLVAYAIANCKGLYDLDRLPKNIFSTLLLDLAPNGNHVFEIRNSF